MLSGPLRALLALLIAGHALTGTMLYVAPAWAAANFAWKISPFVAMTMGGWCLGTAIAGFIVLRRGDWARMLCAILYLALFGLFEAGVLVAFRALIKTESPLALLYLGTIALNVVFAIAAVVEALRRGDVVKQAGARFGAGTMAWVIGFVILVGFLGLYGLLAVPGMRGLNASIFPEVLTPFSLRAFGAFYLALALAVIPMIAQRGMDNLVSHGFAMYALIVLITLAAFVFIGQFDFANRPTQLTYIGIYLLVGAAVAFYLAKYGTGAAARK
ncbi:MAG: hypothetical protein AB7O50_11020 [Pseudolabrys sp.]